jgi:hypothetical protein
VGILLGPSEENFERLVGARDDKQSGTAAPELNQPVQLGAVVKRLKEELGGDAELVKQAFAEFLALERQNSRNHFESRLEYARQVAERDRQANDGLLEYGLQTLKWSFLLNAGAVAIVVAYIGGLLGKLPGPQVSTFAPFIKAIWPFAVGCACVVLSGAAGYFNFCYASSALPSAETLHNFFSPDSTKWPVAKFQRQDEPPIDFYNRYSWRVNFCRKIAIGLAVGSGLFFMYGVYRVLRAALI